ncbi:MAG: formyltransferase family protein, partial [Gammaproteobacteria bacterium]
MSGPRIAYAANRSIGLRGLELLLEAGLLPDILMLPDVDRAEFADEMKGLVPGSEVVEGKKFREAERDILAAAELDYILSVHYPYIIPREVFEIPRIGTLNLHPSYLPFNRGWHTPTWAIVDGNPYGATLHWVDESLDTGEIALQKRLDVRPDDTAHTLYERVLQLELELLREALPLLVHRRLPRAPQPACGSLHLKEELRELQRLELTEFRQIGEVVKLLRALTTNNWDEAAYFEINGAAYR